MLFEKNKEPSTILRKKEGLLFLQLFLFCYTIRGSYVEKTEEKIL